MSWQEHVRIRDIADEVVQELEHAIDQHDPMTSLHHGYAVILEELDELWDEVKKKKSERDPENLRTEAIQVAAMAIRFVSDLLL